MKRLLLLLVAVSLQAQAPSSAMLRVHRLQHLNRLLGKIWIAAPHELEGSIQEARRLAYEELMYAISDSYGEIGR
jgi:hypothetical protein